MGGVGGKDMHAVIVSLGLWQDEWSDHGRQKYNPGKGNISRGKVLSQKYK